MTDTPPPAPVPDATAQPNPYAQQQYGQQQPQQYGQPQYAQQPYGYGAYAPKTNVLAIISLVASISGVVIFPVLGPIAGIILGHIATGQIKRTGEGGLGLAKAGLIVGYILTALTILAIIAYIIFIVAIIGTGAATNYDFS